MTVSNCVVLLAFIGIAASFPATFVPKSAYIIDRNGEVSDVIYFRTKRESSFDPLLRLPRSGGSSATAYSSASASASSGSFGSNGYVPNFEDFGNLDYDFSPSHLPAGATIFSRFGEEEGQGVQATGSAQGPKGAFSSTSVSADDSGKVKYAVKSAKY